MITRRRERIALESPDAAGPSTSTTASTDGAAIIPLRRAQTAPVLDHAIDSRDVPGRLATTDAAGRPLATRDGADRPLATRDGADRPLATSDAAGRPLATRDGADRPLATRDGADRPLATSDAAGRSLATRDAADRSLATRDGADRPLATRDAPNRPLATSALTDEALLAACGVGDSAALGALFDRHHAAIFRLVSRLLRSDPAEIDDLVQTTFLEAWRSASRFSAHGSVKSFLYGIAANTVRHHVRGATRRRNALSSMPPPLANHAPDVELARARDLQRLARALDELPHDLRVVYVLCDLEDVPNVEAARLLGIRAGTLGRRLHEARRALREAIEEGGTS